MSEEEKNEQGIRQDTELNTEHNTEHNTEQGYFSGQDIPQEPQIQQVPPAAGALQNQQISPAAGAPQNQQVPPVPQPDPGPKRAGRGAYIAIVILAVAVVFLLGVLIAWKMGGSENDKSCSAESGNATEDKKTSVTAEATEVSGEKETGEMKKDSEKDTEKNTEKETEKDSEKDTGKETEEETEKSGSGDDVPTVTRPAVYATVSDGSSWQSGSGYVVQYNVDIHNMKTSAIKGWEVRIPGFEDAKPGDHWSAEIELDGDVLVATAVDYNTSIDAKGSTNFGVQVEFKDESASKKVKKSEAEVYINGKKCDETIEVPTAAKVEKKRVVEPDAGTAYESHGMLSVKGTDLVDKNGKLYQLKGVSTHGIAWFPDYVNPDAFKTFRDDWGANLIRLAMYTGESGGYCSDGDRDELKELIDKGVEYASELGMYVIIDWHILSDNNPKTNQDEAVLFFDEMSKKYADYGNVLYEICNEPNGGTKWSDIKEYAEAVIPVIRKNSPDSVIIVGTPTWSQDVDEAAKDPLEEYSNIMYTLHFYAATHKDNLRDKLRKAREDGLPIFISEFGICDASGNGGIDYGSADEWFQLIEDFGISYAAWNISNKDETSALIRSDCTKTSDWSDDELSESGLWLKNTMKR